jgi:hypothetical protein
VFLNGNGAGENSHISTYIKILPGEYDALLRWPFSHSVSFTLFDQSSVPENVSPCLMCYGISGIYEGCAFYRLLLPWCHDAKFSIFSYWPVM